MLTLFYQKAPASVNGFNDGSVDKGFVTECCTQGLRDFVVLNVISTSTYDVKNLQNRIFINPKPESLRQLKPQTETRVLSFSVDWTLPEERGSNLKKT